MDILGVILGGLGVIAALVGVAALTEATFGVGMVAIACFLGILARLAQATAYHRETKARAKAAAE